MDKGRCEMNAMNHDLVDTLENIASWLTMPTMMLTEKSPKKWVRVVGFLCCFPLCPLLFVGLPFLLASALVDFFRDI